MNKQIFLVIEGTDGCGKKTQSEKLLWINYWAGLKT